MVPRKSTTVQIVAPPYHYKVSTAPSNTEGGVRLLPVRYGLEEVDVCVGLQQQEIPPGQAREVQGHLQRWSFNML